MGRVCIVISTDKEIPDRVQIYVGREVEITIEYEWLPEVCTKCKSFGHDTSVCQKKTTQNVNSKRECTIGETGNKYKLS